MIIGLISLYFKLPYSLIYKTIGNNIKITIVAETRRTRDAGIGKYVIEQLQKSIRKLL